MLFKMYNIATTQVDPRSLSYTGEVIKAVKYGDYFRTGIATHFLQYQYST
jgi:hypothetical protein